MAPKENEEVSKFRALLEKTFRKAIESTRNVKVGVLSISVRIERPGKRVSTRRRQVRGREGLPNLFIQFI